MADKAKAPNRRVNQDAALATPNPAHPEQTSQRANLISLPSNVVAQLLPRSPVPVALGTAALAVAGVIEWPIAASIGLGYLALRRWH